MGQQKAHRLSVNIQFLFFFQEIIIIFLLLSTLIFQFQFSHPEPLKDGFDTKEATQIGVQTPKTEP